MIVDYLHNHSVQYTHAEMREVQAIIQAAYNKAIADSAGANHAIFLLSLAAKLHIKLVSGAEQESIRSVAAAE